MTASDSNNLLVAVEDLFYALIARLNIEVQNIDLCQSFHFDLRNMKPSLRFLEKKCLPEPRHLRLILEACIELLKSDYICGQLNTELIRAQETDYIQQTLEMGAQVGCFTNDPQGYRRYIASLITNPDSPYRVKWHGLNPIYDAAPSMILATLSEKYIGVLTKEKKDGLIEEEEEKEEEQQRHQLLPANGLVERSQDEMRHVLAHRESAYAILNNISVGEYRRREGQWQLGVYAKSNLCICFSLCSCSRRCTIKGARKCPCTSRLNSYSSERRPDFKLSFIEKCSDLAATLFEGLSAAYRGMSVFNMMLDLNAGLDNFHEEIVGYREICEKGMLSGGLGTAADFEWFLRCGNEYER